MKNSRRGFTLVELIVVIAILGILAAVAIPAYKNYVASTKEQAAKAGLEQLGMLLEQYVAENGKLCPDCGNNDTKTYTYTYEEDDGGKCKATNTLGRNNPPACDDGAFLEWFEPKSSAAKASGDASLYHYVLSVKGRTVTVTAKPQTGRGAPAGDLSTTITY